MDEGRKSSGGWLVLAALGVGAGVVALEQVLFSLLTGRPMHFAADVEPVYALLAAAPFLILALMDVRRRSPWLVGLALTLAFHAYVLFQGVSYQRDPDGSGANIGLGLIALFVVPPFVTAACLATLALQNRARPVGPAAGATAAGRALGCLSALAIGAAVVIAVDLAVSLAAGERLAFGEMWPVLAFQTLLVATPFGLLALAGIGSRAPWLVGLALTLLFWGFYAVEGVVLAREPDRPPDIDLLALVTASPLIVALASFAVHAWERRRRRPKG